MSMQDQKNPVRFGATVRYLRHQRRFSQQDLADRLGVSDAAVSHWEREETRPTRERIVKLADVLGCSVSDLSNGVGWPISPTVDERLATVERKIVELEQRLLRRELFG